MRKVKDFEKPLNIEDPMMAPVKEDMNAHIQKLLSGMISKGASDGSLSVKIHFTIDPEIVGVREIKKLSFKYKVSSTINLKEESQNEQVNEDDELIWVDDQWILMPITGKPQRTLLDDDEEDA